MLATRRKSKKWSYGSAEDSMAFQDFKVQWLDK